MVASWMACLKPVVPAESETKSRVDKSVGVSSETRRKWKPRSHLSEGSHDHIYENTNGSVGDEEGTWTGPCESRTTVITLSEYVSRDHIVHVYSRSNNKTSANSTTDGNHSNLSRLEASVQVVLGVILVVSMVMVPVSLAVLDREVSMLLMILLSCLLGRVVECVLVVVRHFGGRRTAQLLQASMDLATILQVSGRKGKD